LNSACRGRSSHRVGLGFSDITISGTRPSRRRLASMNLPSLSIASPEVRPKAMSFSPA
jgi:hypothetical protein